MLLPEAAPVLSSTKRYVIERELGQGGMGVVYQALDLERRTRVALKAISHRDAITIYRLKNEFRQLADLSHPNLVTLHELCNEGAAWFFTMELVNGSPFDQYCNAARNSIAPSEAEPARRLTTSLRILRDVSITLSQRKIGSELPLRRSTCNMRRLRNALRQLVEGVAALHDAGKLHRDLKPSNVLVTPEGRVVVLDFGLVSNGTFIDAASQEADRTVGGSMFGTPAYMSPEQAAGEAVTPASDWYSVGTMLYEALTGELPFDGTVVEILRRKDELEPPPPAEFVTGVPDDLDFLCRELLRRDPARRPTASDLLRYLTGHSAPPPAYDAQSSPRIAMRNELFVGRNEHMHALRDAFETAKGGKPVTVLVHGVSGIGKSALVRCFANELIRSEEAVVLRGRCYERENVPYKAFDNIVDALSRYLMRLPAQECLEVLPRNAHALAVLFPVLRRVKAIAQARKPKQLAGDAREQRNQAFAALKELLLRISDFHPLVINIDDLQWADIDSARLLSFLLGPSDPPPLLLVGTYRRDEVQQSPFLTQILSERGLGTGAAELRELPVDALSADEGEQLAAALLEDAHKGHGLLHGAIAAEGEGVPFFITELVRHMRLRGGDRGLPANTEPISLEQVLRERIESMPIGAQRLLEVFSVAGGPLEQGVAIEAAGLAHGDRSALLALRAARLIRTRGTRESDTAETYHDRVRETVCNALSGEQCMALHGRIAFVLERNDLTDPERLVLHYSGAGDGMRAGETAIEAAHAAARKLAFNRAAELYKKAIDLMPAGDAKRRSLNELLGDALAHSGHGAQAAEAYLAASEGVDDAEARRLQRQAAQQYLRAGRSEGLDLARSLLQVSGLRYPTTASSAISAFVWARCQISLHGLTGGGSRAAISVARSERLETLGSLYQELSMLDPLRGAVLHSWFLRDALHQREPLRLLQALSWEVFHQSVLGGVAQERKAREALERLRPLATQLATPYATALVLGAEAAFFLFTGRYPDALAPAREADRILRDECRNATFDRSWVSAMRYGALEFAGDLNEMIGEAPERMREADERDDNLAVGLLVMSVANAHLASANPDAAMAFLERERKRAHRGYTTVHHLIMLRTADSLLFSGQGERAFRHATEQWPLLRESQLYRGRFMRTVSHYMRARSAFAAYLENGNEKLLRLAVQDCKLVDRLGSMSGYPTGLLGCARYALGDVAGARALLEQSRGEFTRAGLGRCALYAERQLGKVIGGSAGAALIAGADTQLATQGIVDPERWTWMHFSRLPTR